jgi:D-glycero-D-manno-heptose 1,7-bisphosphate phosphatase
MGLQLSTDGTGTQPTTMPKAVFIDRDGVINRKPREGEYITSWTDFHFLPGVAEAIALLKKAGYAVIVVTNQRCVAKGLIAIAELEEIHARMRESLARSRATLDGIYYCPHDYQSQCKCRKPAPGMLLEAAQTLGLDLGSSWMVGDSDIDIQAGKNAGCKTARVGIPGKKKLAADKDAENGNRADVTASSLLDSVRQILIWDAGKEMKLERRTLTA